MGIKRKVEMEKKWSIEIIGIDVYFFLDFLRNCISPFDDKDSGVMMSEPEYTGKCPGVNRSLSFRSRFVRIATVEVFNVICCVKIAWSYPGILLVRVLITQPLNFVE